MKLIQYFSEYPQKVFLVDGIGALVTSASLLGVAYLKDYFGMPEVILFVLAGCVAFYALYSFSFYFLLFKRTKDARPNWKPFLKVIATANLLYCLVMLVLLFIFYEQLTLLGIGYFIFESLVIVLIALFELKIAQR